LTLLIDVPINRVTPTGRVWFWGLVLGLLDWICLVGFFVGNFGFLTVSD
jgi:uncharacterized membrane protein